MGQEDIRVAGIQADLRISQVRENTRIAEEFIAAMNARNLEAIGKNLHPQVHFVGPTGETHNRESFLENMREVFAHLERVDVTSRFSSNYQSAYVHNMFFAVPIGLKRAATVITHEDGLIKKIEMIYDAKPIGNRLDRQG
jgi:hypothetical protein